jgi:peptidoglycan/xylan/chitin deacetylase (PgdA/CDA1 family)
MKRAYLTIDDAPSKDFTGKMEYLYQQGIPAIFFCVGESMQRNQAETRSAIKHGFLIGNHSFSHPFFSDLSLEDCQREILQTDELIEQIYNSAGVARPAKYFRFPYFDVGGDKSGSDYQAKWSKPTTEWFQYENDDKRREIQQYLQRLGYSQPPFEGVNLQYTLDPSLLKNIDVRCTFDQVEYWYNEPNAPQGLSSEDVILARMDEDLPYEGRSLNREDTVDIILVHDHEQTTELFYRIIDRYLKKGIKFLNIP